MVEKEKECIYIFNVFFVQIYIFLMFMYTFAVKNFRPHICIFSIYTIFFCHPERGGQRWTEERGEREEGQLDVAVTTRQGIFNCRFLVPPNPHSLTHHPPSLVPFPFPPFYLFIYLFL